MAPVIRKERKRLSGTRQPFNRVRSFFQMNVIIYFHRILPFHVVIQLISLNSSFPFHGAGRGTSDTILSTSFRDPNLQKVSVSSLEASANTIVSLETRIICLDIMDSSKS